MAEKPGGEPTEEPSPRRLEEARRKGQVARSADLSGAVVLVAGMAALASAGAASWGALAGLMVVVMSGAARGLSAASGGAMALDAYLRATAPPLVAMWMAALGVGLLQTRGLFAVEAVKPDIDRLSPGKGLSRIFGGQAALELGKGLAKLVILGAVAWVAFRATWPQIARTSGADAQRVALAVSDAAFAVGLRVGLTALALGGLDYMLQLRKHRKSLMMTRDEVRREHKESEGDPQHKAERKRLHKQLMEQRRIEEVRRADFVVVNPDHIAVAVRYDQEDAGAPVVVARGERLIAEMIKDEARRAGVPIFRDVTLARSLHEIEEGEEIPEALYEAVAELLRVAYGAAPGTASASSESAGQASVGPIPRPAGAHVRRA